MSRRNARSAAPRAQPRSARHGRPSVTSCGQLLKAARTQLDPPVAQTTLERLEQTLRAAAADPTARGLLERGRLGAEVEAGRLRAVRRRRSDPAAPRRSRRRCARARESSSLRGASTRGRGAFGRARGRHGGAHGGGAARRSRREARAGASGRRAARGGAGGSAAPHLTVRFSGNRTACHLESSWDLAFGKVTAAEGPEGARRGVVTPFARPSRRLRRGDERLDQTAEIERLTRENADLRAQLAAHNSKIVIDAALSAAARLLAVVQSEVELRIAEGRWALQKSRNESNAALAAAHEEIATARVAQAPAVTSDPRVRGRPCRAGRLADAGTAEASVARRGARRPPARHELIS